MRKTLLSCVLSVAALAAACASSGALPKIPIQIVLDPGTPTSDSGPVTVVPTKQATIAFQVIDACTKAALSDVFVQFADGSQKQTNPEGYAEFVKAAGDGDRPIVYVVTFQITDEYEVLNRSFALTENRQFPVPLKRSAGCPKPEPPPVVVPPVQPLPSTPIATPPAVTLTPLEESAGWSNEQWRVYILAALKRTGSALVNDASMRLIRSDLMARGVDFQNGWRGDLRPRVYLPVAGCPAATRADVPECSYNRTVDLGQYGQPWDWIVR